MKKALELEIRGRMMAVENIQMVMLAHVARQASNPVQFMAGVMANVSDNLTQAEAAAESDDARKALRYAIEDFRDFTKALLAHINEIAAPAGNG